MFDRASSLIWGNKMPTRPNRGFYCRSYCLLSMFRAPLCPSSGAQEYYTVVAACGISCCGFRVVGLVSSWRLCVRFAGCCSILQICRSAIKTSVASSWHFISKWSVNLMGYLIDVNFFRRSGYLTLWRRNFLLNFSTSCIWNVNNTGTKKGSIMK